MVIVVVRLTEALSVSETIIGRFISRVIRSARWILLRGVIPSIVILVVSVMLLNWWLTWTSLLVVSGILISVCSVITLLKS